MRTVFLLSPIGELDFERAGIKKFALPNLNTYATSKGEAIDIVDLSPKGSLAEGASGQSGIFRQCLNRCFDPNPLTVILIDKAACYGDPEAFERQYSDLTGIAKILSERKSKKSRSSVFVYVKEDTESVPNEQSRRLDAFLSEKFPGGVKNYSLENSKGLYDSIYSNITRVLSWPQAELGNGWGYERDQMEAWRLAEQKSANFIAHEAILKSIKNSLAILPYNLYLLESSGGKGASTLASKLAVDLRSRGETVILSPVKKFGGHLGVKFLLQSYIDYLERFLGKEKSSKERQDYPTYVECFEDVPYQPLRDRLDELIKEFSKRTNRKLYIFIDFDDRFGPLENENNLQNISSKLGIGLVFENIDVDNVRVIATVNGHGVNWTGPFDDDGTRKFPIPALTEAEVRKVISAHFNGTGRTLPRPIHRALMTAPGATHALALKVMLTGVDMLLDDGADKVLSYLSKASPSLVDLVKATVEVAAEKNGLSQSLRALRYINGSYLGLRQQDLKRIFDVAGLGWNSRDFASLVNALRPLLVERVDGRIDFISQGLKLTLNCEPRKSLEVIPIADNSLPAKGNSKAAHTKTGNGGPLSPAQSKWVLKDVTTQTRFEIFNGIFQLDAGDPVRKDEFLHQSRKIPSLFSFIRRHIQRIYKSGDPYDSDYLAYEFYAALHDSFKAGTINETLGIISDVRGHTLRTGGLDVSMAKFLIDDLFAVLWQYPTEQKIAQLYLDTTLGFLDSLIKNQPSLEAYEALSATYNRECLITSGSDSKYDHYAAAEMSVHTVREAYRSEKVVDASIWWPKVAKAMTVNTVALLDSYRYGVIEAVLEYMDKAVAEWESILRWYPTKENRLELAKALDLFSDYLICTDQHAKQFTFNQKQAIASHRLEYAKKAFEIQMDWAFTDQTEEAADAFADSWYSYMEACLRSYDLENFAVAKEESIRFRDFTENMSYLFSPEDYYENIATSMFYEAIADLMVSGYALEEFEDWDGYAKFRMTYDFIHQNESVASTVYDPSDFFIDLQEWAEFLCLRGFYHGSFKILKFLNGLINMSLQDSRFNAMISPLVSDKEGYGGPHVRTFFRLNLTGVNTLFAIGAYDKISDLLDLKIDDVEVYDEYVEGHFIPEDKGTQEYRNRFSYHKFHLTYLKGEAHRLQGNLWEAAASYEKAFEMGKTLSSRRWDFNATSKPIFTLFELSRIQLKFGQFGKAMEGFMEVALFDYDAYQSEVPEENRTRYTDQVEKLLPFLYHFGQGEALVLKGDLSGAKHNLGEALADGEELHDFLLTGLEENYHVNEAYEKFLQLYCEVYEIYGKILTKQEYFDRAIEILEVGRDLARESVDAYKTAQFEQTLASIETALAKANLQNGDLVQAFLGTEISQRLTVKKENWGLYEELSAKNMELCVGIIRRQKTLMESDASTKTRASSALDLAEEIAEKIPTRKNLEYLAQGYYAMHELLLSMDLPSKALETLKKSVRVRGKILKDFGPWAKARLNYALSLTSLGDFQLSQGKFDAALDHYKTALDVVVEHTGVSQKEFGETVKAQLELLERLASTSKAIGDKFSSQGYSKLIEEINELNQ